MAQLGEQGEAPVASSTEGDVSRAAVSTKTAPQTAVPIVSPNDDDAEARTTVDLSTASKQAQRAFVGWTRTAAPPPRAGAWISNVVWGVAQPFLGFRVLIRHRALMLRAIPPVIGFLIVCGLIVDRGDRGLIVGYYLALIAAAPLSPILFTKNYAKLAAEARPYLGLERREPYLRSFWQAGWESVLQLFVVGVGAAPLAALVADAPLVGVIWAAIIGWAWALHWIVVEAFDSARSLPPGVEQGAELEALEANEGARPPWYAAPTAWKLPFPFNLILLPVRLWTGILLAFSRRWRAEVEIVERRPWLSIGFGLGAAVVLAIPVVNLLFRPAVVIAAAHILGRLEGESPQPPEVAR